jgi:hypothetical protein
MIITMNDPILNVDGTEVKTADKTLLFVDVIISSMTASIDEDKNEAGESMLKKWDLAQRAQKARGGTMEITVDEASFIKERIRKVYVSTTIYANAHRLLESAGK